MGIKSRFFWGLWLCWSMVWAVELPEMGTSADTVLSPAEERELGAAFFRRLRQEGKLLDDPVVDAYLESLGYRLASQSDQPELSFRFFAVRDDSVNAFAVPGGFIGVHAGLIVYSREENELASVVAHEIAHVVQRHITRTAEATGKFSVPAMAAMIAAVALGAKNPELAQAAITTLAAGNIQMQLNFTRAHEREADRVGMEILARSGFDPNGMPAFFGRMQEASRLYDQILPDLLRTHPVTVERIAESQARAEQLPRTKSQGDPVPYHLIRARILVATHPEPEKLRATLEKSLAEGRFRDERALRYGIVLAGLRGTPDPRLREHLAWLRQQDQERAIYLAAAARLDFALGEASQGLTQLAEALRLYPGSPLLLDQYAEALIAAGQPARAKTLLEKKPEPAYPHLYRLLAEARHASGEPEKAKLAMGRYYFAQGDTASAIEQLEQIEAKGEAHFHLRALVDAQLKQWKDIRREEKEREKKR